MARAWIGLGSNLGDRAANVERALGALQETPGVSVRTVSSFLETAPVGGPPQGDFLNAAAGLETTLEPHALLAALLEIERRLGRTRGERWGPRLIDLDLLLYEDRIIETADLVLPHPRMHERRFVLAPLAEIAPDAVHPVLKRSIRDLLADCKTEVHHRDTENTEKSQGMDCEQYTDQKLTEQILAAGIEVHRVLGPGLLESAYETALCRELALRGLKFERQKDLPVEYKGVHLDAGYRLDLVVEGRVVVEIKSVDGLAPIHQAQVLTYLRLSGLHVGLLLNFNVPVLKDGMRRLVL